MESVSKLDDQQFCLRWNNFQANITTQFENLRDEEDFTDVTIACEGQQLQAHKIVLSACSPLFKELFKSNPCSHPIIFMRDVEAQHIVALMEFMYAGEVNVAQAQLASFLKTAESLKIRGLTDTSSNLGLHNELRPLASKVQLCCSASDNSKPKPIKPKASSNSTVTSSQDFPSSPESFQSTKVQPVVQQQDKCKEINLCDNEAVDNPIVDDDDNKISIFKPKMEIPDYFSDEEGEDNLFANLDCSVDDTVDYEGEMQIVTHSTNLNLQDSPVDNASITTRNFRKRQPSDEHRYIHNFENVSSTIKNLSFYKDKEEAIRKVKLGEGVEIYEDQLRTVKWSDYRKLTRGLATILFSPTELATCSVTGQRWSRATDGNRPVKPALDRTKVQAIISYVATRFPTVEISRIKQVLAYKCKENSTAFKMKAVRYYR